MKSFADWTDEIRALMNPPRIKCDGNHGGASCADPECWSRAEVAPMADTCNLIQPTFDNAHLWECTPKGTIKWHNGNELAKRGIIRPWKIMTKEEFRKEYEQDWSALDGAKLLGIDPAETGGDTTAASIAFSSGRRMGKSVMQGEWYKRAMEFLASQDYSKTEERIMAQMPDLVLYGTGITKVYWDEADDEAN